jgi:hypothetical protein
MNTIVQLCWLCSNRWRTGGELKSETENWDTAFTNYKFTIEQLKLMRNFNIRYECLDARDDHHAQLQKSAGILPVWDENLSATCDGADFDNMYTTQPDIENDEIPLEFLQLVRQLQGGCTKQ